jgi:hypothetical protein
MPTRWAAAATSALYAALLWAVAARPAASIPIFAHQYGVTCEKCHSVIPHLNEFGAAFLAAGYRIPGVKPGPAFPISAKANLVGSSENQGDGPDGAGLPKTIVDEVELFTAGAIGSRASYLVEQYAVDGGMPGLTRDAWINDRINPWTAKIPVYAQAGSFTLPLLVDPETFRDSYQGYSLYEQTVGANSFNFFDPKIGVRAQVGDVLHGLSGQVFAGQGHDRQSGLATIGTDWMGVAQDTIGALTVGVYRYQGVRPAGNGLLDQFGRTGYNLVYNDYKHWSSETVLQTGYDSNCGIPGHSGCGSSGGFTQLRYMFNKRLYALARYEGTNAPDGGFGRDGVVMMGYGLRENARVTIEDVISHTPATMNTLNVQFTLGY